MTQQLVIDPAHIVWSVAGKAASAPHALTALAAGQPLLVLMHGLGSNERDLAQLAPFLPAEFVCASLRAPLAAYLPHDGCSWFPLSLQPGGVGPEQAGPLVRVAADAVLDWLSGLRAQLAAVGAGIGQVAVMGFSQGGVMVTTLLRLLPGMFFAGVNCSGFISPGVFEHDAALAANPPALFWGRDEQDPVISAAAITATAAWSAVHTALETGSYSGIGHSISRQELQDISAFLTKHLAAATGNS